VGRTGSNRICLFRKFSQVISPRNVDGFGYEDRKIVETLRGEPYLDRKLISTRSFNIFKHILIRDTPESAERKREGAKGGLP